MDAREASRLHTDLINIQLRLLIALREVHEPADYPLVKLRLIRAEKHLADLEASDEVMIQYGEQLARKLRFALGDLLDLARITNAPPAASPTQPPPASPRPQLRLVDSAPTRGDDPETSHEAAASFTLTKLRELHEKVLLALLHESHHGGGGLTDLELDKACDGGGLSTYRTRRAELRDAGYVEDSGQRRLQNGRNRIVWRLTESGLAEARRISQDRP